LHLEKFRDQLSQKQIKESLSPQIPIVHVSGRVADHSEKVPVVWKVKIHNKETREKGGRRSSRMPIHHLVLE